MLLCASLLFGCARLAEEHVPFPQGEVEVRGVLRPSDLSPTRRGSFLLSQAGEDVYYVESSLLPLQRFIGRELLFRGVVESNTDPRALPVLVVQDVGGEESSSGSSSLSSSSTSSRVVGGSGRPCGGEVLCPIGEYCATEALNAAFGHCRSIENGT